MPGGVSGDDFHGGSWRAGEETGMTVSAAKLKTAAHICVRSAAETSLTGSPGVVRNRASDGQRVDLPGVKDDRAVHSLDIEFQPLGRVLVHDDLQSIAAFAAEGNTNGLGLFHGGRCLDGYPLVEDFGGDGQRGDEALDHAQPLQILGIGLGQRIDAVRRGGCPRETGPCRKPSTARRSRPARIRSDRSVLPEC